MNELLKELTDKIDALDKEVDAVFMGEVHALCEEYKCRFTSGMGSWSCSMIFCELGMISAFRPDVIMIDLDDYVWNYRDRGRDYMTEDEIREDLQYRYVESYEDDGDPRVLSDENIETVVKAAKGLQEIVKMETELNSSYGHTFNGALSGIGDSEDFREFTDFIKTGE